DRDAQAGGREVVRDLLLRAAGRADPAQRSASCRGRRRPGILPDDFGWRPGAQSALPQDGAAQAEACPAVVEPETPGFAEPTEVEAAAGQDPRPGETTAQGASPPSGLEIGPSLRVDRGRTPRHPRDDRERPVGPIDRGCRLVRLPADVAMQG